MINPYYQDSHRTLYSRNFLDNDMPDESVQMVVTSPPYWGLRKYSGEQDLIWGGDKDCQHEWTRQVLMTNSSGGPSDLQEGNKGSWFDNKQQSHTCRLCGAWRDAYGLEPTPEMYVQHTIEILREISRVLRKDGVVFWNIGDSYYTHSGGYYDNPNYLGESFGNTNNRIGFGDKPKHKILKSKDLCLIPFRVAIAAQEDGWWVRSDIIWSKPNPMPESVTDRPTNSHEYILVLTKSAKYYWDQEAVREEYSPAERWGGAVIERAVKGNGKEESAGLDRTRNHQLDTGRNLRSVWTFPTQPYPEAHFAVFPEKLPELCIKAASKVGDTVLDPFAGAGTTLWVASKLNRKSIGFELSEEYCRLIADRNRQQILV